MRTSPIVLSVLTVILTAGAGVQAQSSLKPGLWETRVTKMTVDGKDMLSQMGAAQEQMRQALAQMPPEQRKKMEAMMPAPSSQGMAQRMCITPEMAARDNAMVQRPPRAECESPKFTKNGSQSYFEMTCKQGRGQTVIKGETQFAGDQMSSKVESVTSEPGGVRRITLTESQMKFLGSDCGSVKPIDQRLGEAPPHQSGHTGSPAKNR